MMEDRLTATAIPSSLTTRWLGCSVHYYEEITSTNVALQSMLAEDDEPPLPPGTILLANYQSRGRGRLGREWHAPPGTSLLLSIYFRPDWPGERAQWLTMLASLAAAEAMEAKGNLRVHLKWPNDLVVGLDGAWHKVGGLLMEGGFNADGRLQNAILGVGLNVNIPQNKLPEGATPPTSLMIATGNPVDRLGLLLEFLKRLEDYYEAADAGQSPHHSWKQRLITLNKRVKVTITDQGVSLTGSAEDVDAWGRLLVRDDGGRLHRIAAGDVTLRE